MKIVIVGSGIAGLIAALELAHRHEVTLVTKASLADSNTRFAQGGIAAVMFPDDSIAEHIDDTLRAGAGLCNRTAVEILCAEGPQRIRDLIAFGVAFDKANGELARGREAAHSRARVLHAGGDATGLAIETTLVNAVRAANVRVLEHTFASALRLDSKGHIAGIEVIFAERSSTLAADAVILASGGAGNLYRFTTNPPVTTGDGVAMALRAGAQLADVEFYQFHPTALTESGCFLISEAVRGDGAVLRAQDGTRFMQQIHPEAELAPRDVVARGIAAQMAKQNGEPVLLDATALGADFLAQRFPTIDAACKRAGLDWAHHPIPVAPAAHYWMGGVRSDEWGRTSIPGLFAVGEAACTGVHGANRLASNSLLESLVFAWRAAHLLRDADSMNLDTWPEWSDSEPNILAVEPEAHSAHTEPITREAIQTILWNHAGIVRSEEGLREAAVKLAAARVEGKTVHSLENTNLLELGRMIIAAARARRESRGAHYRTDFPETSDALQHQIVLQSKAGVPC